MRWWLLGLAACGRLDFAPLADAPGATGDTAADGASHFCETVPAGYSVCADFDEGQPVQAGWTSTEQTASGTVVLSPTSQSAPTAALASFGPLASGVISTANLEYTTPTAVTMVRLEDDFMIPRRPAQWQYEVEDFEVDVAGVGKFFNDITLVQSGADVYREEFTGPPFMTQTTPIPTIAPNIWHHKVMTLDLAAKTYSLTIDGTLLTSGPCFFTNIASGNVIVTVGVTYADGVSMGEAIYVDNVVVSAS